MQSHILIMAVAGLGVSAVAAEPAVTEQRMPDEWERRHGFNPADPSDGASDADHDGCTNLEEFLNATNPHGSSVF